MQKELKLQDRDLMYTFRQSRRARRVRLTVGLDGEVTLTAPVYVSEWVAERFLRAKAGWVMGKLDYFKTLPSRAPILHQGRRDYLKHKEAARVFVMAKVQQFGALYGNSWGRISIKNQKSCWGSCSRKKNLNFNYKILFLPEKLQDYVIVHELCHLQELNHSKKFWELVAQTVPDHGARRKELKHSSLHFS